MRVNANNESRVLCEQWMLTAKEVTWSRRTGGVGKGSSEGARKEC